MLLIYLIYFSFQDVVGPDNIPGCYSNVLRLATFLVLLQNVKGLLPTQLKQLKDLWRALSYYDKMRTVFSPRHQAGPLKGRFKSPRKKVAPGVESIERDSEIIPYFSLLWKINWSIKVIVSLKIACKYCKFYLIEGEISYKTNCYCIIKSQHFIFKRKI